MASETLLELTSSEHPPGCQGNGWVDDETDGRPLAARCPGCQRDRSIASIAAFTPPRFRQSIELPTAVAEWVQRGHDAEGLFLIGGVGSGKTHTAWNTTAAWCLRTDTRPHGGGQAEEYLGGGRYSPTVVFTRATGLLDELRPGNDGTRQRVLDYQKARLLVIDDLGAEKPSEWTCEKLYEIVDERYAQRKPLLVTSNVPPAKLADFVGERVASRFAEMCQVVPIVGADRRKVAAHA